MSHILFEYSTEKDAENWISRLYDQEINFAPKEEILAKYPQGLLDKLKRASSRQKAFKIACDYLKSRGQQKLPLIEEELKALKNSWKLREDDFFEILEKLLKKPIYTDNFKGYLTTFFRCPYSEEENWFMVNFWSGLPDQLTTIAHEILHLQFLNQYRPLLAENSLSEKQIQDLKEALTFLLNEKEFSGILLKLDKGHPEHANLRRELKILWDQTKDFSFFLPEAVKIL